MDGVLFEYQIAFRRLWYLEGI